jgi:hypothetical protein
MDLREAALTGHNAPSRHPWELARVRVMLSLLRDGVPRLFDRPALVLDVGCGDAFMIDNLSAAMPGARFLAIDSAFTPELLECHEGRHRDFAAPIQLFRSLEDAAMAQQNPIDCVLLLDVIEHIENDVDLLRRLSSHPGIHDDTVMLITVPAYQGLFSRHDRFLGHCRRYDRALLSEHACRGGFAALRTGHFFSSLVIPRMLMNLFEPLTPQSSTRGIGDWRGNKFVGTLFEELLVADFWMSNALSRLGIVLPGLSVYAFCRRSA